MKSIHVVFLALFLCSILILAALLVTCCGQDPAIEAQRVQSVKDYRAAFSKMHVGQYMPSVLKYDLQAEDAVIQVWHVSPGGSNALDPNFPEGFQVTVGTVGGESNIILKIEKEYRRK